MTDEIFADTSNETTTSFDLQSELIQFQLLNELNINVSHRIAKSVIHELIKLKEPLLSGDDSPLKNCWDEICVQVQDEYSMDWWAYEATIKAFIESKLEKEPQANLLLLSYMSDVNVEHDSLGYSSDDAIQSVYDKVIVVAMDYRNSRIAKYMDR